MGLLTDDGMPLNDEDELDILQEHPDESLRAKVQDAVRSCPKQALSIQDD